MSNSSRVPGFAVSTTTNPRGIAHRDNFTTAVVEIITPSNGFPVFARFPEFEIERRYGFRSRATPPNPNQPRRRRIARHPKCCHGTQPMSSIVHELCVLSEICGTFCLENPTYSGLAPRSSQNCRISRTGIMPCVAAINSTGPSVPAASPPGQPFQLPIVSRLHWIPASTTQPPPGNRNANPDR